MPAGHRRRRPRGGRAWHVVAAVLLGLLVATSLAAVPAARALESSVTADVQKSQMDLQRGLKQLEDGYKNQDARTVQAASGSFANSRERLQALGRRLRRLDSARGPAAPVWLRSRVTTLDAVIGMATNVDRAGEAVSRVLLTSGLVGSMPPGTAVKSSQLTDVLASIRDDLAAATARLAPSTWRSCPPYSARRCIRRSPTCPQPLSGLTRFGPA